MCFCFKKFNIKYIFYKDIFMDKSNPLPQGEKLYSFTKRRFGERKDRNIGIHRKDTH